MAKELIGICDLTHTATGSYATNLMPYPIASIKSYLMHFSNHKDDFEVKLFKDPNKFIKELLEQPDEELLHKIVKEKLKNQMKKK